jgi:trehalose 6-phosphate phosphatase
LAPLSPQIDDPINVALFLDLDGTVFDIAASPTEVGTPPGLTTTLGRLQAALDGAVAVLTGRQIEEVDRLLTPLRLTAAGVHGAELRLEPEGTIEVASDTVPTPLLAAVEQLADATPGLLVEPKGVSIAVHYRAAPDMERMLKTALLGLLDSHQSQLVLSHGRRVFELTPRSSTKGTALARLMEQSRFRGRVPVMIGDDMPDEAALDTAARLGGVGLKVKGEHFARGTAHFSGPADVRRWLEDFAEMLVR